MPKKYSGKGTQEPYDEDFHFYRDLDPNFVKGGDPINASLILKKGDVPGATN